jgi:hypothetical protein
VLPTIATAVSSQPLPPFSKNIHPVKDKHMSNYGDIEMDIVYSNFVEKSHHTAS